MRYLLAALALLAAAPAHANLKAVSIPPAPATTFACDGSDQTDAISAALVDGANLYFTGTCKTGAISKSGVSVTLDMAPDAVLEPAESVNILWHFTGSDVVMRRFAIDGLGLAQQGVKLSDGTFHSPDSDIVITDMGYPSTTATDGVFGLIFDGTTAIEIGSARFSGFQVKGDGACNAATPVGGVRGIYMQGTGWADIKYFYWEGGAVAGDNGEQIDVFHAQLDTLGGVVHDFVVKYNQNTRRAFKRQSGNWTIKHAYVVEGGDFTPVSGQQVGLYNLNALDNAGGVAGSLTIDSGYVDCSGFPACVTNSGGVAQVQANPGLILQGPTQKATRSATVCNAALSSYDPVGFLTVSTSVKSGINGSTLYGFGTAVSAIGKQDYVRGAYIIDPVDFAAILGSSTQKTDIKFNDNTVITQTSGNLNSTRAVRFLNVAGAEAFRNKFIEDGNTTHASRFIDFTDSNATGFVGNNYFPSGMSVVTSTAAGVTDLGENGLPQSQNSYASVATTASSNTAFANVNGLTANVVAGKTYAFRAVLFFTADATGGHKWQMSGTATATAITYQIDTICNSSNAFVINAQKTSLDTGTGQAGCTAGKTTIEGVITVNAAGTLVPQFAQNAASGTSSSLARSSFTVTRLN